MAINEKGKPMDNFFPTSNPDGAIMTTPAVPNDRDDLIIQIQTLRSNLETMTRNWDQAKTRMMELSTKIDNVEGYIRDQYDITGEVSDDLKEVAALLEIEMTKTVNVSVTVTFSGTATVPMDFDPDDLEGELSFHVDEGYNSDIEWDLDEDDQSWDIQEG